MLQISPQNKIDNSVYKEKLYTLKVLHAHGSVRILAFWMSGFLLAGFIILFFPWQQNIRAEGEVTAFTPQDRPQTIETAIAGRIKEWHVREGQYVDSGTVLVVISEVKDKFFDPNILQRIGAQVEAKESNIFSKQQKVMALDQQITALQAGLSFKLEQTRNKISQLQMKLKIDSADLQAARVDLQIARRQLQGAQTMYDSAGLIPLTKLEETRNKLQQSQAKVTSAENKYSITKSELVNARIELSTIEAEAMDKISKATSEKSATIAEIADSEGSLAKLETEQTNLIIRNEQYQIRAPQSGYIIQALKSGIGETVKEGDALFTIMPANAGVAVALYVRPMDVPLLDIGRHVRIQFEGWPALQVTGWPSVSVGTFGGRVAVIDYVASENGKYRVLIVPDNKNSDQPWPKELRLGSGTYGWVMLDDVPIYFELWRQINGFPPSLQNRDNAAVRAAGKTLKESGSKDQKKEKDKDGGKDEEEY